MAEAPLLDLRGITKRFPGVLANDKVDFDLLSGEVHALLGENGAGKSTLMNILYGLYRPDAGEILLQGKRATFSSARDAIQAGIGMVHQHFMLIPVMTVAENIVLGVEPREGILLDERGAERRVRELSERFGLAVSPSALVSDITVGQEQRVEKTPATPGSPLLHVDGLRVRDDRGIEKVRGVSFDVRAGEIVGIAGVDGNGQTELIDAITGLQKVGGGSVSVAGHELAHATAREMLDAGVGHIPEDRQRRGLVLEFSIAENIALHDYAKAPDARWGWIFPSRMVQLAARLIRDFDVRGGGPLTRAGGLSGGNQQKVVAAREIARDPKVLIAAQPTRGLDVGAIEYLHRRLVEERDKGRAILLVSLELEEIFSLSDRILVLYEGEIVGDHTGEVSEEELGLEMLGGKDRAAA